MTRFVRRGIRGTAHAHLIARPTGPYAVEVVPSPDGNLPGAACKGVDPDLFFAEPDEDDADADPAAVEFATRRALAVCASCPVKDKCLAGALRRNEPHGVFGGLTAAERRALKRSEQNRQARQRGLAREAVIAAGVGGAA
ncbi:WhiB family transcriptional regulator [Kitasatospora sp. MBT63]|uniref:WhiB family transcriptional regulator n=1 Tax=Kitasatospora sp. MBT63 TaxID=1444768 RepID=UPI0009E7F2F2|nr:WhiB family transcriptional regulator [Kitasatospora sp. MBT63]